MADLHPHADVSGFTGAKSRKKANAGGECGATCRDALEWRVSVRRLFTSTQEERVHVCQYAFPKEGDHLLHALPRVDLYPRERYPVLTSCVRSRQLGLFLPPAPAKSEVPLADRWASNFTLADFTAATTVSSTLCPSDNGHSGWSAEAADCRAVLESPAISSQKGSSKRRMIDGYGSMRVYLLRHLCRRHHPHGPSHRRRRCRIPPACLRGPRALRARIPRGCR